MNIFKRSHRFFYYAVYALCFSAGVALPFTASAQLPPLPGEASPPPLNTNTLPDSPNEAFDFGDVGQQTPTPGASQEPQQNNLRQDAFDAALEGLLPLRPNEIRTLLERFDRTQESVETPIYPNPKPEVVVENISLDPGATPAVIKLAYGNVTTVTFLDSTGAPWPVQDITWAGNFEVIEVSADSAGEDDFTHVFRISPQSEFAFGNMSITLTSLRTPVIITLETNRELVHYRFDAVIPEFGPLASTPIIATNNSVSAGNKTISSILDGVIPESAERLEVSGVDGRTSAYLNNGLVYLRTPLSLLSPGWNGSASSSDGTQVYEIGNASVVLLSDKGQMVRARLSQRTDILEDVADE